MDFAPTETQKTVAELATKIFKDRAAARPPTPKGEAADEHNDAALWSSLADAGLLGVSLGEDVGGAGNGLLDLCALLGANGAAAAPVPLWAVLATGAAPVEKFGTAAQRKAFLPDLVRGKALLVAALSEPDGADPRAPLTIARAQGDGWRLTGVKTYVPVADRATRILIPASVDGDVAVFLVDPRAPGVTVERQVGTSGEVVGQVTLHSVAVGEDARLGSDGRAVLAWLLDYATIGLCAQELGIVETVLRITAKYTSQRVQFDRPVATFQAVAQRAADAYIDVETIRLTLWEAAWRLEQGLPAERHIAIAKYWAAEGGQRVTYAAQHLHGGMGYDLEYGLARYYPLSKQLELTLGGGSEQLARLGAMLAE